VFQTMFRFTDPGRCTARMSMRASRAPAERQESRRCTAASSRCLQRQRRRAPAHVAGDDKQRAGGCSRPAGEPYHSSAGDRLYDSGVALRRRDASVDLWAKTAGRYVLGWLTAHLER